MAIRYGFTTGYPRSYFSTATRNDYFQRIKAVGAQLVRVDVDAAVSGDLFELYIASAVAAGLKVRALIGIDSTMSGATYAAKCTSIADKYRTQPAVVAYEMGNEPNIHGWANGAAYAAVAKAGSDAVKASFVAGGLPNPEIVLGGMSPYGDAFNTNASAPLIWLASVYTLGAGHAWFDSVDFHPYGYGRNYTGLQAFNLSGSWGLLDPLYQIMVNNGDGSKKLHVGEHGGPTWSDGVTTTDYNASSGDLWGMTEQAVADFIGYSLADIKTRSWAGDMLLYSFRDLAPDEQNGNREGHFGIVHNNYTNKPAYTIVLNGFAATPAPPTQTIVTDSNAIGPIQAGQTLVTDSNAIGPITTPVPANTAVPVITGAAVTGSTLSASTGDWTNLPTSYTYQWKRAGNAIGGATSSQYLLVTADVGQAITVTVTATNAGGSTAATSASVTPSAAGVAHYAAVRPALTVEVDFPDNPLAINSLLVYLAANPYSFYRLSEASGSVAVDASGNFRNGSLTGGAALTYQVTGPITGEPADKALGIGSAGGRLNMWGPAGSDNIATGPPGSGLTGGFSFECWYYFTARPAAGTTWKIFAAQDITSADGNAPYLVIDEVGGVYFINPGGEVTNAYTGVFALNTWTHFAFTIDNETSLGVNAGGIIADQPWIRLYRNGAQVAAIRSNTYIRKWGGWLTYMVGSNGAAFLRSCRIDEAAIYTYVLSATEIAHHYGAAPIARSAYPLTAWTALSNVRAVSCQRGRGIEQQLAQPDTGSASATVEDSVRALEPEYSGSPNYPNVRPQKAIRARLTLPGGSPITMFQAFVERLPVDWRLRRALVQLPAYDALAAFAPWPVRGYRPQETTGARINAILDKAGWPTAARLIDTGQETVVTENWDGSSSVLDALRSAADSELGMVFVDADGNVVFHDRDHRTRDLRSTVSQALFSEAPPGLPYVALGVAEPDLQRVFNEVTVTTPAAGSGFAFDSASQAQNGPRPLPERATRLATLAAAQAQAARIVARLKDPALRFTQVTLEPERDQSGSLWAVLVALRLGDRVTVSRQPAGGGAAVTRAVFIEAIAHDWQLDDRWTTTLTLSPV